MAVRPPWPAMSLRPACAPRLEGRLYLRMLRDLTTVRRWYSGLDRPRVFGLLVISPIAARTRLLVLATSGGIQFVNSVDGRTTDKTALAIKGSEPFSDRSHVFGLPVIFKIQNVGSRKHLHLVAMRLEVGNQVARHIDAYLATRIQWKAYRNIRSLRVAHVASHIENILNRLSRSGGIWWVFWNQVNKRHDEDRLGPHISDIFYPEFQVILSSAGGMPGEFCTS